MIKDIAYIAMYSGLGGCAACLIMILVNIIKLKSEIVFDLDDKKIKKLKSKISTNMQISPFWIIVTIITLVVTW